MPARRNTGKREHAKKASIQKQEIQDEEKNEYSFAWTLTIAWLYKRSFFRSHTSDGQQTTPEMGEEQRASSFTFVLNSFTRTLDERLDNFAQAMQHQSEERMGDVVRKARSKFVCIGKGNLQQLDQCMKVLDKLEDATSLLAENSAHSIETAKRKLDESTEQRSCTQCSKCKTSAAI